MTGDQLPPYDDTADDDTEPTTPTTTSMADFRRLLDWFPPVRMYSYWYYPSWGPGCLYVLLLAVTVCGWWCPILGYAGGCYAWLTLWNSRDMAPWWRCVVATTAFLGFFYLAMLADLAVASGEFH